MYPIHEPQVECIGKGKAHKKFEFGTKVDFVTSSRSNWIVGAEAYPGNPHDGQTSKILGFEPEMAICGLGYRGNNYEGECNIQVVNYFRKRVSWSLCRWWNRRSTIEPVIGHCKSEHRMDRNQLRGKLGDELNVIFAAAGFNFRKFWEYRLPGWAGKFLDPWNHAATFSRIEPMKDFAKILTAYRPLILNYFRAKKQFNNGIAEGLNRKINLTVRNIACFQIDERLKW